MAAPGTVDQKADIYSEARAVYTFESGRTEEYPLQYHKIFDTTTTVGGNVVGGLFSAFGPLTDNDGQMASDAPYGTSLMMISDSRCRALPATRSRWSRSSSTSRCRLTTVPAPVNSGPSCRPRWASRCSIRTERHAAADLHQHRLSGVQAAGSAVDAVAGTTSVPRNTSRTPRCAGAPGRRSDDGTGSRRRADGMDVSPAHFRHSTGARVRMPADGAARRRARAAVRRTSPAPRRHRPSRGGTSDRWRPRS